ncbi:MAG TPA: copper amine oxidase N-terminal domain-containing protein [Oscillospiraceae bacterium]|nr:copper amine oxidase N-terminal domain-containing protein [Oscillospiraceae bacterium]
MTAKRLIGAIFALCLVSALCAGALADSVQYPPNPQVEYQYATAVSVGTVRYISQTADSALYYADYWGNWTPKGECLTASISMALSYIGVDDTPAAILDYGGGSTNNYHGWGGSKYLEAGFADAFANYVNGAGSYTPPIVHLGSYSSGGHYVVVIGKVSDNVYAVADAAMDKLWNLTINGSTASYDYYGASKTDTLGSCMQYYLDNSALAPVPPAGEPGTQVIFTIGSKTYLSGGAEVTGDVAPYIVSGYTYLPLYCVCAELGAQVTWNGETKTVTLTKGGTALVLTIGSKTMTVNGTAAQLATAPEVKDSRTCLPISPITRAFGASIAWDASARTVTLTLPQE